MPFYDRKATRIPNYDYTVDNYYFITVCTHEKRCIFGKPDKLNELGKIASECLGKVGALFESVTVDNYIVMPNHIHAIIIIENNSAKRVDLSIVVGQYKSAVTRKIHEKNPDFIVWQRSFHDHIIRHQSEYEKIWQYVQFNSQKWNEDCFYKE